MPCLPPRRHYIDRCIIHVVSPSCQSRACPKPEADAHFLVQCLVVVYSFALSFKTVTVVYKLPVTDRLL